MTQVLKSLPASPKAARRRLGELERVLEAELFRALADPTRLRMLACLARCRRACSVSEVAGCCDVDLSVVSRHLAVLADAGVVVASKRGRQVMYAVRCAEIAARLRGVADAFAACSAVERCARGTCEKGACADGCC